VQSSKRRRFSESQSALKRNGAASADVRHPAQASHVDPPPDATRQRRPRGRHSSCWNGAISAAMRHPAHASLFDWPPAAARRQRPRIFLFTGRGAAGGRLLHGHLWRRQCDPDFADAANETFEPPRTGRRDRSGRSTIGSLLSDRRRCISSLLPGDGPFSLRVADVHEFCARRTKRQPARAARRPNLRGSNCGAISGEFGTVDQA